MTNASRTRRPGPARLRARPSCPPERRAASRASSGSTPSRSSAARTTSSARGARSMRWQRDRTVSTSSSGNAVTSRMTVRGGGSSSVFNSVLADSSRAPCSRSASNRTTTLRAPSSGARDASGMMRPRTTGPTWYVPPSGSNSTTSGCAPRSTRSCARSSPSGAISAAAKQRAASSTPEPRGPTSR